MRFLLLIVATVLFLAGCGDDAAGEPGPTVTPDHREGFLSAYIDRNFSDTSWHDAIRDVEVDGATITIRTDLGNVDAAKRVASSICTGISGYIFAAPQRDLDLDRIRVMASSGQPLVVRDGQSGSC